MEVVEEISRSVSGTDLPEWTTEQQEIDFAALKVSSQNTNAARFTAADVVARVVPMGVQGADKGVRERVALLSYHAAKSIDQIEVLRRVGSRWLPEYRSATVNSTVDWSAIRSACVKTPNPGNELDPCKVLVKLCATANTVSKKDFEQAYAEAVENSLPKDDAPEPKIMGFDELLEDIETPKIAEVTELDHLIEDIDAASGPKAERDTAKTTAAEVLLWIERSDVIIAKYSEVKGTAAAEPVRAKIAAFIKTLVNEVGISPDEVFGE